MATFNRASYLQRSVPSVQRQSFQDWELLIVDDGSEDSTLSDVREIVRGDSRIRLLHHSNRGLAYSLNVGIMASVGRFITFIDSDDEYLNKHLELRANLLDREPGLDITYGSVEIVGDPYVVDYFDRNRTIHVDDCRIGATFFGRREVFVTLGGYQSDPQWADIEFMTRAEQQFSTHKVPDRTYRYYRDTPGSITNEALKTDLL